MQSQLFELILRNFLDQLIRNLGIRIVPRKILSTPNTVCPPRATASRCRRGRRRGIAASAASARSRNARGRGGRPKPRHWRPPVLLDERSIPACRPPPGSLGSHHQPRRHAEQVAVSPPIANSSGEMMNCTISTAPQRAISFRKVALSSSPEPGTGCDRTAKLNRLN